MKPETTETHSTKKGEYDVVKTHLEGREAAELLHGRRGGQVLAANK